jgi:hypothetical protein
MPASGADPAEQVLAGLWLALLAFVFSVKSPNQNKKFPWGFPFLLVPKICRFS